jgi:hypothetical protein
MLTGIENKIFEIQCQIIRKIPSHYLNLPPEAGDHKIRFISVFKFLR